MEEEETGYHQSDASGVRPALLFLDSKTDQTEEKRVANVALKTDSEEFNAEVSTVPLSELGSKKNKEGEEAEGEDDESLDEEDAEDEADIDQPTDQPVDQTMDQPTAAEVKPDTTINRIKRVQVDPNASIRDTAENSSFLTSLPVVPDVAAPYTPILYTFRVKAKGRTNKIKNAITKPPPFYLQFDHAIAVIWSLFNKEADRKNLGIVQLQWALHFLESIYSDEGIHPKDIQLCINAIQDELIDKYAAMSEEPVVYACAKLGDFVHEDNGKPFSVNYSQMIQKCPQSCPLDAKDSTALLDRQLLEELENIKKVVGIESIDLTQVVSKEQVLNILNDWKKEQIDKIQDELKMLYVIEDMMKNSDSQNFDGYTDESQFKTILKKNE